MLKDDMIIRQIRQFAEGLLRTAMKRKQQEFAEALLTVDELIEDLMSLKPDVVARLDGTSLVSLLSPAGELDGERAALLGRALLEKAFVQQALAPEQADATRAKGEMLIARARAAGVDPDALA
jgi:hypothetical protein